MRRKYRSVIIGEDGDVVGQRTLGPANAEERWVTFRANIELLHISEALDRYPAELTDLIWSLQDGYGRAGYTPPQGWDWSGIRDSSPAAIRAMRRAARQFMTDSELKEVLGV